MTAFHSLNCTLYRSYVHSVFAEKDATSLAEVPFLPVRAFKAFQLKSISDQDVFKIMTSSGTTGDVSRIYLDRETARLQSQKLVDVFGNAFSKTRSPMLVIDAESTVAERHKFSARTAAINGFSLFSKGRSFALDNQLELAIDRILAFIEANSGTRIFMFGFTFVIWQYFVQELKRLKVRLPLSNAFLLHGGGWKKLAEQNISNERFKAEVQEWTGCSDIRNYYGMVEQTGTIFMECPFGNLHAAAGSDTIIRDPVTLDILPHGKEGLIQVFSAIQKSYPGHSLLTEDVGHTQDAAQCGCGHQGTIISIKGRLKKAEIRGCSDAYRYN
ncbi:MAG: long-chain fatty acid--CoA ligase [Acetobacter sp.]|uniref:LuxE/PaaK family acyltransferase n=1 Tax=Acetobacter sp. TaxID=440 RepID=UPI0039EC9EEA